jgi:hypothetical protein
VRKTFETSAERAALIDPLKASIYYQKRVISLGDNNQPLLEGTIFGSEHKILLKIPHGIYI